MKIYALIDSLKDRTQCIQAFSTEDLARSAMDLYELHGSAIVEVPLLASEVDLRDWTRFQCPVQLYFALDQFDTSRPISAYTDSKAYGDHLRAAYENHPWLEGTLDGLRRSVEKGLRMYRVHMHDNGEIGAVEGALAFNAVTTCSAHLYVLDHEMRNSEAGRGANREDGPYFIYVYALDETDAINRARPFLELRLGQDKQPARY